jgi:hypothetical protein
MYVHVFPLLRGAIVVPKWLEAENHPKEWLVEWVPAPSSSGHEGLYRVL